MNIMDKKTKTSLEFQMILNKIDPKTPYGRMLKNKMRAYRLGEEEKLKKELSTIEAYIPYIKDKEIRRVLNNLFNHIKDLRGSINRSKENGILTEVELFEIKSFIFILRELNNLIHSRGLPVFESTRINPIKFLERLLDPEDTGILSFYIYDDYSPELKGIRSEKRRLNLKIREERSVLKKRIEKDLNLKLRMDDSITLSKSDQEIINQLEDYPHLSYESESYMNLRYTLKLGEEIIELERYINHLNRREEDEEVRVRQYLSKEIGKKSKELYRNILNLGRLDLILAKAKYAVKIDGVKPNIIDQHKINIQEGRHPIVEEFLKEKHLKFTPISISLEKPVNCITGVNMGGKTISLKLVGLLSTMAQYGLFVPAKSMDYGLNEFIKSSIGDTQSTKSGLSTFGGEIKTIQEAITLSDKRGLILIDELARGTNPQEGYAISKAIVSYLKQKNTIALLTTHYENITNGEEIDHYQVIGLSKVNILELEEKCLEEKLEIINKYMDYRLRKVDKDTSIPKDAINIARIMGLEPEVIQLAEKELE